MNNDMKLKDILKGITDDYDNAYTHNQYNTEEGYRYSKSSSFYKRRHGDPNASKAFWTLYLPNILGFLLGCALMRLFGGGSAAGYAAMGVLGSVVFGMIDCMIMKKMEIIPSLIRNVILTGAIALFFGIVILIVSLDS